MPDFSVDGKARCPHCGTTVQFAVGDKMQLRDNPYSPPTGYTICWVQCPACSKVTIVLSQDVTDADPVERVIYPLSTQRAAVPVEVPSQTAVDYEEAAMVLPLSAKASAALSRRCLQAVLVDAGRATKKNLSDQIVEVTSSLPTYLEQVLDQVRIIGNFSAHPLKDTNSGVIVEVEPGEAEWNLDVLDELFDFYYVRPAAVQHKTNELNEKLKAAGRKLLP